MMISNYKCGKLYFRYVSQHKDITPPEI